MSGWVDPKDWPVSSVYDPLPEPADLVTRVLTHHAQLFRGLSLGYMHRALHEVDAESRARAESMADAYEIVATTLEASANVEALPEGDRESHQTRTPTDRGCGGSSRLVPPSESAPDWKPAKRVKDPETVRAQHVYGAHCLLCGNTPVSVHHLLSKSLGGDDVPENLVLLCGDGVQGCHGFVERHDRDVCRLLRVSLSPEQIDYLVEKKSWAWLDSRYPETL